MSDERLPLWKDIEKIRKESPLVHNITNYVVMNSTANALLSLGASPVMAHAFEEVEDMTAISQCLVINIGTLSPAWVEAMQSAMKRAATLGRPIVFDPVGAGATGYRTSTARTLMESFPPSIIRANASEVLAIAGSSRKTKGVDSTHSSDAAIDAARSLVQEFGSVVVISGETDFIVGKERTCQVHNGCSLMSRVTGMGCTATALSGAFAAVNSDYFTAATNSMALMGICGEIGAKKAHGPGTFQSLFLDALYEISPDDIEATIRVK